MNKSNIKYSKSNIPNITYHEEDNLIYLPIMMKSYVENLKMVSTKTADHCVYTNEKYVAYADLILEFTPAKYQGKKRYKYSGEYMNGNKYYNNQFLNIKVVDIRHKEYFDKPLTNTEKIALESIANGMENIAQKAEYIKKCGRDIRDCSFVCKFI